MNLVKLIEEFQSEGKCREYLEELRWPHGVECPRCGYKKTSEIKKRNQYECVSCEYQFSVKAGTILNDSHLPLWKWFLATYLICESKKGISSKQLERTLGISYKTAWFLSHRIREAMGDVEQPLLKGIIEIDETLIGGKIQGKGKGYRDNKAVVIGAVERDGQVRLKVIPNVRKHHIEDFVNNTAADETDYIYTDELRSYNDIGDENTKHETVEHSVGEYVRGDVHTNTIEGVWSLLKRSVVGSYHQVSLKHLPAYLDEIEFRYNNRENPFLFRDTLLIILGSDPLTYKQLTGKKGKLRPGRDPIKPMDPEGHQHLL